MFASRAAHNGKRVLYFAFDEVTAILVHRAQEIGLIRAAVPEEDLDAVVEGRVKELLQAGPHAVAEAKARGVRITCEASPHHLSLTEDDVLASRLDTRLKMNPPLRAEADRQALIDGLRDGTIDCIATDHAPHAREEKEVPFEEAPMGTTGLETAFAALYTELVVPGVLSLALGVDRLSSGAAVVIGNHTTNREPAPAVDSTWSWP